MQRFEPPAPLSASEPGSSPSATQLTPESSSNSPISQESAGPGTSISSRGRFERFRIADGPMIQQVGERDREKAYGAALEDDDAATSLINSREGGREAGTSANDYSDSNDEEEDEDEKEQRYLGGRKTGDSDPEYHDPAQAWRRQKKRRRQSRTDSVASSSYKLYTPTEEQRVLRKLDRNLVLFVALLYMLSFLDRSNIGNALIASLPESLSLTPTQIPWLLTTFYITYILFEWMTLLYRIIPAHIYIPICVFTWGLVACLQSLTTSFSQLLFLRALLGIAEAAFGPGVPFYLSFFFRREELAKRTGWFIAAAPLASSFASSLAWVIMWVGERSPVESWRLLFLVEGAPSLGVAVWAWWWVPDGPGKARWLSARERKVAVLRLRKERGSTGGSGSSSSSSDGGGAASGAADGRRKGGLKWMEIWRTLKDPKCYVTAAMFFSCNVAFSSLPVFLPKIISEMGHTALASQALSAPPYLLAFAIVLLTSHLSDKHRTRSIPIMIHGLLASSGYFISAIAGLVSSRYDPFSSSSTLFSPFSSPGPPAYLAWLRYAATYLATIGFFSAITIIITWTINNQASDEAKGTGVAMLNILGQLGPLLGTRLYPESDAPYYVRGMAVCGGFMVLVAVLAGVLRVRLRRENERLLREWRVGSSGGSGASGNAAGGRGGDVGEEEMELVERGMDDDDGGSGRSRRKKEEEIFLYLL
ncbi:hypothetical protein MMC25_006615 [Agyrium rufum]|nr:hypothetical protein [Agyrium rufum]